jgi:uncharacterized protein YecT (DUF1311 family)
VRAAALLVALAAAPAAGQELPFSTEPTESCLAAAADRPARDACVGRSADACTDTPDGSTTVGMGFCYGKELAFWDTRLNAAYGALMAIEEAGDAELKEYEPTAPSPAAALGDMQRAWIGYRDAACDYERSQWGGGTGGGPATADCLMRLTAAQALALEDRLAQRRRQ